MLAGPPATIPGNARALEVRLTTERSRRAIVVEGWIIFSILAAGRRGMCK